MSDRPHATGLVVAGSPLRGAVTMTMPGAPHTVWSLVTDITRYGEWSPECTGGAWTEGEGPLVDVTFRGTNRLGPIRWTTTCTVDECVAPRTFAFTARFPALRAATRWQFTIEAVPGGSAVTQAFESVGTPGAMVAVERLLGRDRRLVAGMRQTLGRLADAVRTVEGQT